MHDLIETMIHDAHAFYRHGWLMGTSGNLSARLDKDHFVITASGRHKGSLSARDFVVCTLNGTPTQPHAHKPSAETQIHSVIYTQRQEVGAIYHVHEPFSALCSARDEACGHTSIKDLEMIKGFGIWEQDATIHIPILPNHAHIPTLASAVENHLLSSKPDKEELPCVNILKHGPYVWGRDLYSAKRHLESMAYCCSWSWQWSLYKS